MEGYIRVIRRNIACFSGHDYLRLHGGGSENTQLQPLCCKLDVQLPIHQGSSKNALKQVGGVPEAHQIFEKKVGLHV